MPWPAKSEKARRRSRRACNDCRARKIGCDGLSPCSSCLRHDRECAYNPATKVKTSLAVYVAELEKKNRCLESALQKAHSPKALSEEQDDGQITPMKDPSTQGPEDNDPDTSSIQTELLETMTEAAERLSIDDRGNYNYHGHFAGLTLLEGIHERCNQLLQGAAERTALPSLPYLPKASEYLGLSNFHQDIVLPPRRMAERLVEIALDDACCLMTFVHRPTFDRLFDRIYEVKKDQYDKEEQNFLPVIFEVLALGEIFLADREGHAANPHESQSRSLAYFCAGRNKLDPANYWDLSSVQALLFMVLYLQATGRTEACHSYLSVAIASSLRMGIHRSAASKTLDPVRQETRKRVFWALQTMDTYITTMLGLPKTLDDQYVDQDLPQEVDDEAILNDGIRLGSTGQNLGISAVNAHTRLVMIMSKIGKHLLPVKGGAREEKGFYRIKYAKIIEAEDELNQWFHGLPTAMDLSGPGASKQTRTQLRLRLAYAHVQMVLYRPFLHHIIWRKSRSPAELRSYACASACVKAAMQVIWLVEQLENQAMLAGPYWLTIYMTFFASMSIIMFALGNVDNPTVGDSLQAAEKAKQILARLADSNNVANDCALSLTHLFDRLPLALSPRADHEESPGYLTTPKSCEAQEERKKVISCGMNELDVPLRVSLEDFCNVRSVDPSATTLTDDIDKVAWDVDHSDVLQAMDWSVILNLEDTSSPSPSLGPFTDTAIDQALRFPPGQPHPPAADPCSADLGSIFGVSCAVVYPSVQAGSYTELEAETAFFNAASDSTTCTTLRATLETCGTR